MRKKGKKDVSNHVLLFYVCCRGVYVIATSLPVFSSFWGGAEEQDRKLGIYLRGFIFFLSFRQLVPFFRYSMT